MVEILLATSGPWEAFDNEHNHKVIPSAKRATIRTCIYSTANSDLANLLWLRNVDAIENSLELNRFKELKPCPNLQIGMENKFIIKNEL